MRRFLSEADFATLDTTDRTDEIQIPRGGVLGVCEGYLSTIAGGATQVTFYITAGAGTDKKLFEPVTVTIAIDATDATLGYFAYSFSEYFFNNSELHDFMTDGAYLHAYTDVGSAVAKFAIHGKQ